MLKDMTGKKFGLLTVTGFDCMKNGQAYWKCKCECGNIVSVRGGHLRDGNAKSCGCYRAIANKKKAKHMMSRSHLYNVYRGMLKRCYLPSCASYPRYGGRGITICDEWNDKRTGFETFRDWALSHGYKEDLSIDRIDTNGNYCPENCRWATPKQQANNRSTTILITYGGITKPLSFWADLTNANSVTLRQRHRKGWSDKEVVRGR